MLLNYLITLNSILKTGTHTYANWQDVSSSSEDEEFEELIRTENIFISDNKEDDIELPKENPVTEWVKKMYNTILFYGLDPIPERKKTVAKALGPRAKKSPFFTKSEQLGQMYVGTTGSTGDGDLRHGIKIQRSSPSLEKSRKVDVDQRAKDLNELIGLNP